MYCNLFMILKNQKKIQKLILSIVCELWYIRAYNEYSNDDMFHLSWYLNALFINNFLDAIFESTYIYNLKKSLFIIIIKRKKYILTFPKSRFYWWSN